MPLFIHDGFYQIFGSIFIFMALGSIVENLLGKLKFLGVFLITGIVTNKLVNIT